jgi:RNA polymerase sigma factor (sigma-70 family)
LRAGPPAWTTSPTTPPTTPPTTTPTPSNASPSPLPVQRSSHPADSALSDAALLARCRTGDGAAWHELVERYERPVFSVARSGGLDVEDAADVTQTTFVALLDSITRLRSDERLASWLLTVARRTAWRVRRRREQEAGATPGPPAVADDRDWEQIAALHEGLARLGPPCRDLLAALYFDPAEPSYAEIAQRMGRAIGGIGPMRARCLERLRDLIEAEGWR